MEKCFPGAHRFFKEGEYNEAKEKLEAEGIECFMQNGEGITTATDLVVVVHCCRRYSGEVQKAKQTEYSHH
ncbi:MAG: hypothetical protein WDO71_14055 [Bacteroidota bacterium]